VQHLSAASCCPALCVYIDMQRRRVSHPSFDTCPHRSSSTQKLNFFSFFRLYFCLFLSQRGRGFIYLFLWLLSPQLNSPTLFLVSFPCQIKKSKPSGFTAFPRHTYLLYCVTRCLDTVHPYVEKKKPGKPIGTHGQKILGAKRITHNKKTGPNCFASIVWYTYRSCRCHGNSIL
jgi:hypothetical protein